MGLSGSTSGNRWMCWSIENTESESRLHEMWIRDFCKNTPMEIREWIRELA